MSRMIVAAGVAVLLVSGIAVGGTARADDGKPLELLQLLKLSPQQQSTPAPAPRAKTATRKISRSRVVAHRHRHEPVQTAMVAPAPSGNAWPVVSPDASANSPQSDTADTAPPPVVVPSDPVTSQLVVAGQTVQIAQADAVNEIDLAAADAAPQAGNATPAVAAAGASAMSNAQAQPKSDSLNAAAAEPDGSNVGSASWIAQVLAALGGAVAAGSAAWFLIGATPQRTYG